MLFWLILSPIIVSLIGAVFFKRDLRKFVIFSQVGLVLYTTFLFIHVRSTGPIINDLGQSSRFYAISLYADHIAIVLVWLTSLLFLGVLLYSYHGEYFTNLFGFLYLILQTLIMAIFLSSDLFNLYILIEVSTVVVTILIMFNKSKQAIYDGMLYLLITVISSSFWLLGIAFLYRTFGYLDIYAIESLLPELNNSQSIFIPYALILSSLSLKLALFPLSSWLPRAYGSPSAPPGIPAILAGVYEMTRIYLFARITIVFSQVVEVNTFFLVVGFITSIVGFIFALGQDDMRLLLSYSTISQVGLMIVGITIGTEESFWGSMSHMVAHSLFKMVLFLSSGILERFYNTRNIDKIKGIFKVLPLTGFAVAVGLLGMTGAPFFNGSITKLMISYGSDSFYFSLLINLISFGTILYSIKFASMLFGQNERMKELRKRDTTYDISQWVIFIFSTAIILTGVFGNNVIEFLFEYTPSITLDNYIQHSIIYIISFIIAFVLYKGWISISQIVKSIRQIELTFNGLVTALVLYFVTLVGYMYLII